MAAVGMDDWDYREFLDTPGMFQLEPGRVRYVHIYVDSNGSKSINEGWIEEQHLQEWLDNAESKPTAQSLKLLMLWRQKEDFTWPFPITKAGFELVMSRLEIPRLFLESLVGNQYFFAIEPPIVPTTSLEERKIATFWTHNGANHGFAAGSAFNLRKKCTTHFIVDINKPDLEPLVGEVVRSAVNNDHWHDTFVPMLLFKNALRSMQMCLGDAGHRLLDAERSAGFGADVSYEARMLTTKPEYWDSVDFRAITLQLKDALVALTHVDSSIKFAPLLLEFYQELSTELANQPDHGITDKGRSFINRKFVQLRQSFRGIPIDMNLWYQTAGSLDRQINALISQRDNAMNKRIAELSLEMTRASREDSLAMRALAEDSRQIAINTSRDSAAMKIIAAVTILFLPATFTATYFSTSFFNFQTNSKPIVSRWHWIYWVTTIVLTVLIHFIWLWVYKHRERQIFKKFGVERDEKAGKRVVIGRSVAPEKQPAVVATIGGNVNGC